MTNNNNRLFEIIASTHQASRADVAYLRRAPNIIYGLAAAIGGLLVRRKIGVGSRDVLVGTRELQPVVHVEVM